jgi:ribosomal protein S18 acetylase RimI-like enzyme
VSKLIDLVDTNAEIVGDILGRSFADDPVNDWIFANVQGKTAYFGKVAKKKYMPQGFGHVDSQHRGASMWLPPGVSKDIPILNSLDIAAAMIKSGGIASLVRGMKFDAGMAKRKRNEPFYYLFSIGTTPEGRGKGVGGRLMDAGLTVVDEKRMPAYLESSKESNVTFYRQYGFEIVEEYSPVRGCPPLWLMWRKAKTVN